MAKPTQADAETAVRTLIEWAGDDPDREGLIETPERKSPPRPNTAKPGCEVVRESVGRFKTTIDSGYYLVGPRKRQAKALGIHSYEVIFCWS